jgi:hypothetical protein
LASEVHELGFKSPIDQVGNLAPPLAPGATEMEMDPVLSKNRSVNTSHNEQLPGA